MAKRKNKKNSEASTSGYSVELTGLLLILIGFIGFGFGVVGSLIKKFAMFLVGIWWMLLLFFVLNSLSEFLDSTHYNLYCITFSLLGPFFAFGFFAIGNRFPQIVL